MEGYNGKLYAGLGATAGDAEVWRYNGTDDWDIIAGDAAGGWASGFEQVNVLMSYEDYLYAGLGTGAGEGALGWTSGQNSVTAMTIYNGQLTVGLGSGADDADIWVYNGSVWSKLRDSTAWGAGYNTVESLAVYKGDLYAGLGLGTGMAEVWKYDGSAWSQVGGDGAGESPSI